MACLAAGLVQAPGPSQFFNVTCTLDLIMQSFENSLKQLEPYDYVRRKIQEKNQRMLIRTQCATSTEEQTIRLTIANNDPLQWPPLKTTPINELNTKGLVAMVLPTSGPPMVSLLGSEYKTET